MPSTDYFSEPEKIIRIENKKLGLQSIIVIHNTLLGPALGGTRMRPYVSLKEAEKEVCKLAQTMTYKNALAGTLFGGGKAVIIGNHATDKTDGQLRAYGAFLNTLNGTYITCEDSGTCDKDMDIIRQETPFVAGISTKSGNPAPMTALGGLYGIQACLDTAYGDPEIKGKFFAVKGLGEVGFRLAKLLYERGGKLIVADINEEKLERAGKEFPGVRITDPKTIHEYSVHVYCPCSMGSEINSSTIYELNCDIVAGLANNILENGEIGDILHELGVFYAPDFAINSGGVRNIAVEFEKGGYDPAVAEKSAKEIYGVIKTILELSIATDMPTYRVAQDLAEEILREAKQKKEGGTS